MRIATPSRLDRIRHSLTPAEWARAGGMAVTIVGLNAAGRRGIQQRTAGLGQIERALESTPRGGRVAGRVPEPVMALFERDHGPLEYQRAYARAMEHIQLPYPDIAT